jgi:hypothetical protein
VRWIPTWCCPKRDGDLNSSSTSRANKIIHLHMRLTLGDKGHKAKGIPIFLWLLTGYQPEPIGNIVRRCLCPLFRPLDRGGNCIHVRNVCGFLFTQKLIICLLEIIIRSIGYLIHSSQNPLS